MKSLPLVLLLSIVACAQTPSNPRPADDAGSASDAGNNADAGTDAGSPCIGCGPCLDGIGPTTPFEQALIELPPDTWYEAPGTAMREVCVPDSAGVRGVGGCAQVVKAWNGGAYDPGRNRMLVWGGGHDDYWGNELYAFDLESGSWSRLTEPSLIPQGGDANAFLNQDPLPDGQPVSRHTYDGLEILTHLDAFFAHGGSRARDGAGTRRTWLYRPASGWSMGTDGPGGYGLASAYDPTSHLVFVHASESFHIYDPDADSWREISGFGVPPLWPRYAVSGNKTGAVDPTRQLYWTVGNNQIFVWDIVNETVVTDAWVTTGGGAYSNADRVGDRAGQRFEGGGGKVYDAPAPGFDYDPVADAFVGWPDEGAPYILDLASKSWHAGSALGAPTSANSGGTFGRFRHVAAYNVFILINAVDENVAFYKHTAGCGP